jgi:hypothetical protein
MSNKDYVPSAITLALMEVAEFDWDGKLCIMPDANMYKWSKTQPEAGGQPEYWLFKYDTDKEEVVGKPVLTSKNPLVVFSAKPFPIVEKRKHIIKGVDYDN